MDTFSDAVLGVIKGVADQAEARTKALEARIRLLEARPTSTLDVKRIAEDLVGRIKQALRTVEQRLAALEQREAERRAAESWRQP